MPDTFGGELQRIYPVNPYKKAGHLLLWPGAGATVLGFVSWAMADFNAKQYKKDLDPEGKQFARTWTGLMWGGFATGAALIGTAIVMLNEWDGPNTFP